MTSSPEPCAASGGWQAAGDWLWLAALTLAAFSLACRMGNTAAAGQSAPLWRALAGETRLAFSDALYRQADAAFHQGIGPYQPRAFDDWFTRLGSRIAPESHVHLAGKRAAEILPWLDLALRLDPRNVPVVLVAAFWLTDQVGRPDLAERLLADARRASPRDYRLYQESGCLAVRRNQPERAARFFDVARTLYGEAAADEPLDLAAILTYRGLLWEQAGNLDQAADCYRRLLQILPGRRGIQERLDFIASHGCSPSPPFLVWRALLEQRVPVCDREHGGDHAAEHAGHEH